MAMTRAQMLALLQRLEGPVKLAFERAIANAKSRAQITALSEAVVSGDMTAIWQAAGLRDGMWTLLNEQVRTAYVESGVFVMNVDLPRGVDLDFDITNPRAEAWLRLSSAERVKVLNEQQYQSIQVALREGFARGDNPRTVALDIVGRMGPAGRRQGGVLGLTKHQGEIVNKMRNDLDNLDYARYKSRALRDKRWDKLVKRHAKEGVPIPRKTKEQIVTRYEDKWLKHRGDTVARTETLRAINAAADETLHQIVESGAAPRHAVYRIWRHSFSKNEREGHVMMNDQVRGLDEPFVNPITGVALQYPGDPNAGAAEVINCRCIVEHSIDFVAVENVA